MTSGITKETVFQGIPAAPGVAFGKAFIHVEDELYVPNYEVDADSIEKEVQRFEQALLKTRHEITQIRNKVSKRLGEEEAQIFDAHLMVLEDPALIDETIRMLNDEQRNVENAFQKVSRKYISAFQRIDDGFIKERLNDIRDVSRRILYNLTGETLQSLEQIKEEQVIVSHDFTPSDTASVPINYLKGIVTEVGSQTSHVVIMARSANVPAVVGVHGLLERLQNGNDLIVDGYDGLVIVNPTEATLYRYGEFKKEQEKQQQQFLLSAHEAAVTKDGVEVHVSANIEGNGEIGRARDAGSDGIGLYRTEYLFIKGNNFPGEDEQYHSYKDVVERMHPLPVILRTLDLGGDKLIQKRELFPKEDNPFLGCRAIRFCLAYPDIFKDQLRAMLRASAHGNMKIMYPMISGLEELLKANELLEEVKQELRDKDIPFDENLQVGIMIEIPSAAYICDVLADHCDFFSIGTNDLMQYMLAVDRGNDRVAHLYEPSHPAMIRILRHVVNQSKLKNQSLSICGEMAGDPIYVSLLLALGIRELSVSPNFVPVVKYLIRRIHIGEVKEMIEDFVVNSKSSELYEKLKSLSDELLLGQA